MDIDNTELKIIDNFEYFDKKVRVIYKDDEIWFVAIDIGIILELSDTRKSVQLLDEDDRNIIPVIDNLGRSQSTYIINESGLYQLIFQSRKPEAKKFKRWVTKEVLPTIRKTGEYKLPNINDLNEDNKRRIIRDEILKHNKIIVGEAKRLGVGCTNNKKEYSIQFAIFQNEGYKGLYDGKKVKDIKRMRGLKDNENILDFMGSTELGANLFRITQAIEKLRQEKDLVGKDIANNIHYLAGQEVRKAMINIHGIAPENLPKYDKLKITSKNNKISKDKIEIDISKDLWQIALLIMAQKNNGIVLTKDLMVEIPKYIKFPKAYNEISDKKKEPKYKQIIRNLKSNRKNKSNFINLGYAELVEGGFKITDKGLDFVKENFKKFL